MKIGMRKPSLKKSIKARTTGKLKRSVKKAVIPGYGKKGMGWIKDPKKAAYNKIYNKTTFSVVPSISAGSKHKKKVRVASDGSHKRSKSSADIYIKEYNREKEMKPMKVCKYCGTENYDSASVCTNCGAHEFKNKCSNCGTIFDVGNFCPVCGVKVGTKAKICPECGTEYFSPACPNCGYMNKPVNSEKIYVSTVSTLDEPIKKRKTWLWVLGWIIMFPVPITILMLRKKDMNKQVRNVIIAVAWILYIFFAMSGDSTSEDSTMEPVETAFVSTVETEEILEKEIAIENLVNG